MAKYHSTLNSGEFNARNIQASILLILATFFPLHKIFFFITQYFVLICASIKLYIPHMLLFNPFQKVWDCNTVHSMCINIWFEILRLALTKKGHGWQGVAVNQNKWEVMGRTCECGSVSHFLIFPSLTNLFFHTHKTPMPHT